MGMNLAGLLAQNEFLDLQQLESSLKIDLKESRRSTWADAQSESMYKNELMILSKKGRMLIYYPFDFFEEHFGSLRQLALESQECLIFGCSETSMTFVFDWYQFGKHLGEDAYTFEEEFRAHGANRLGLTEEDDSIFDGLFPYIEKSLQIEESDIAIFYKWHARPSWQEPQSSVRDIASLDQEINQLLNSRKAENGLMSLQRLRNLLAQKKKMGYRLPDEAKIKPGISDRELKELIYSVSTEWQAGQWHELTYVLRSNTAVAWALREMDIQDLRDGSFVYKKWWEVWK
ncbi:hypothetical protein [Croceimicrobium sp.]|uniref:hypothetical protein n=1 Tax=Croceimicrobium sp. TaxID=2828340 RepID=UPI003BAD9D49